MEDVERGSCHLKPPLPQDDLPDVSPPGAEPDHVATPGLLHPPLFVEQVLDDERLLLG